MYEVYKVIKIPSYLTIPFSPPVITTFSVTGIIQFIAVFVTFGNSSECSPNSPQLYTYSFPLLLAANNLLSDLNKPRQVNSSSYSSDCV